MREGFDMGWESVVDVMDVNLAKSHVDGVVDLVAAGMAGGTTEQLKTPVKQTRSYIKRKVKEEKGYVAKKGTQPAQLSKRIKMEKLDV